MPVTNGKITAPISANDPYDAMGMGKPADIGYQLNYASSNLHGNINKWSRNKPMRHTALFEMSDAEKKAVYYGLTITSTMLDFSNLSAEWVYDAPNGGANVLRIADWLGYYHLATGFYNVMYPTSIERGKDFDILFFENESEDDGALTLRDFTNLSSANELYIGALVKRNNLSTTQIYLSAPISSGASLGNFGLTIGNTETTNNTTTLKIGLFLTNMPLTNGALPSGATIWPYPNANSVTRIKEYTSSQISNAPTYENVYGVFEWTNVMESYNCVTFTCKIKKLDGASSADSIAKRYIALSYQIQTLYGYVYAQDYVRLWNTSTENLSADSNGVITFTETFYIDNLTTIQSWQGAFFLRIDKGTGVYDELGGYQVSFSY